MLFCKPSVEIRLRVCEAAELFYVCCTELSATYSTKRPGSKAGNVTDFLRTSEQLPNKRPSGV